MCEGYFRQDRSLLDLYERVRYAPAPPSVRDRVVAALDAASGRGRPVTPPDTGVNHPGSHAGTTLRRFMAVAAAIVTAIISVHLTAGRADTSPDVFAEDYERRAVAGRYIETQDPIAVRRFLRTELGLWFEPIRFAGMDLARAEICLLRGRHGAMIMYARDGSTIAHYVIPSSAAVERAPALSLRGHDDPVSPAPVVTWATRRTEQALVADVDPLVLLELARAVFLRGGVSPGP